MEEHQAVVTRVPLLLPLLWRCCRRRVASVGAPRRSCETDGRCSQAVLDFLSTTDVGKRVPAEVEVDAVSAVSELEVQEWMQEQEAGAEETGGAGTPLFLPMPDFMATADTE